MSKSSTAFRIIAGLLFLAFAVIDIINLDFFSWHFESLRYFLEDREIFYAFCYFIEVIFYISFIPIAIAIFANGKKFFSFLFAIPAVYYLFFTVLNFFPFEFRQVLNNFIGVITYASAILLFAPIIIDKVKALKNLWFVPAIFSLASWILVIITYDYQFVFIDWLRVAIEFAAYLFAGLWIYSLKDEPATAYQAQPQQYYQPQNAENSFAQEESFPNFNAFESTNNYSEANAYSAPTVNTDTAAKPNVVTPPERNIGIAILLSIVTCGFYSIYWFVKLNNETNEAAGKTDYTSGVMAYILIIVTLGIYGIYWYYKIAQVLDEALAAHGLAPKNNSILFLILALFGFGIVNHILLQDSLNQMSKTRN